MDFVCQGATVMLFAPCWLDDAKQCPVTNASHGRRDRGIFALAIHLLTSLLWGLSGVRFGSQAILICGWKLASHWHGRKWAFHPCLLLIMYSKSQCETHQITQIRLVERMLTGQGGWGNHPEWNCDREHCHGYMFKEEPPNNNSLTGHH